MIYEPARQNRLLQSITCTAPSKTFNLAGLKTSNIIIPNHDLRKRFTQILARNGLKGANAFGIVATEAAYNYSEAWLTATMETLKPTTVLCRRIWLNTCPG